MQNGFVKGIQEVGDLFESGEVFLPELMMSADAMAGATEVTNAALEGEAAEAKGVIVSAPSRATCTTSARRS